VLTRHASSSTWQVEPGEFTVAVGGLEATLTLLPQSDVEVHAGDTIPWAMWGQPAGHQLPLPVDLDQYVEEHTPRSTPSDDSHGEVHEATIVVHGSSAGRDAGMMLGGMALGAVCAGGAWLAFTRFKRAQQVRLVTPSSRIPLTSETRQRQRRHNLSRDLTMVGRYSQRAFGFCT
jgi:hypothetical protein